MDRDVQTRETTGVTGSAERYRCSWLPAAATWAFFLVFCGQGVRDLLGWKSFGGVAVLSAVVLLWAFVRDRHTIRWTSLPPVACAFAAWCALSAAWAQYPVYSVLAGLLMVATTATGALIGCGLSLREMTNALSRALEASLVLSLGLELFVALVLRRPLAPLYMRGWEHVPPSYLWSEGRILEGGPIQGIVGNRNPLAFIALLTLLCVWVRWRDAQITPLSSVTWISTSLLVLALTRSATVVVALLVCVGTAALLVVLSRIADKRCRRRVLLGSVAGGGGLLLALVTSFSHAAALLGRSPDLTGRIEIWRTVVGLWAQRPVLGWGWTMYWVPWLPLYEGLVVRPDGTSTMSAHNAYLEALMQTGLVGALLVSAAALLLLGRTWRLALRYVDQDAAVWLPALLSTALVVQSLTESRLLSEGNWVLVVVLGTWLGLHRRLETQDRTASGLALGPGTVSADRVRGRARNGRQ